MSPLSPYRTQYPSYITEFDLPKPDINARDAYGWSALHTVCLKGPDHYKVIQLLVKFGAILNMLNNSGDTPLQYFFM